MSTTIERRRFRRAELELPVSLRWSPEGHAPVQAAGQAKDVSLAGVYCYLEPPCPLKPGDAVTCSVEVPPEQMRVFPFTRISGRGMVVRVEPVNRGRRAGESQGETSRIGLAVAFAPDVTALGSIEY